MINVLAHSWILVLTVSLSLTRPKIGPIRIQHSTAAVIGALLTVSLHILPVEAALDALSMLAAPIATIVSLMLVTMMAEDAGLFALVARFIAKKARGDGRRLFTYLFLAGTIAGSIFTNDAAVLIFTPLVFNLIEEVKEPSWRIENKIPFYFSVLYVANIVGFFTTSNPINIIVASLFHFSFIEYAGWMIVPSLISVLVSFLGIALFFWRAIPRQYRFSSSPSPSRPSDRKLILYAAVLGLVLVGFAAESVTHIPVWVVSVAGATILLIARAGTEKLDIRPLVQRIGWDVIAFVAGIFVVARGLKEAGLTRALGTVISALAGESVGARSLIIGFTSAIASAFVNNHPTADTMSWVVRDLGAQPLDTKILALSALIGGDLGPKMLPIGSLAALLWFGILRKRRVHIPYSLYIRIGVPVSLVAVLLSLLALNVELWLYR